MRILIQGAGIAGLSCAIALRRVASTDIVVVERESGVSSQTGTGVAIPPNGARALAELGIAVDALADKGSRLRRYRMFNQRGRELAVADLTRLWDGDDHPYLAVHRQILHRVLLDALNGQEINYDTTTEPARGAPRELNDAASMLIRSHDEDRVEQFDLVIAADGVHSAIRRELWPSVQPAELGWQTWRCVVPFPGLEPETQALHSGPHGVVTVIPLGGDQVYVFAGCPTSFADRARRNPIGQALAETFSGFSQLGSLFGQIARLDDSAFHVGTLLEIRHEEIPTPWKGRTVLVGDALHACSPNMAQGVSLAAEDAVVLAELVAGGIDDSTAPGIAASFWQRRLPRIQHVQHTTRKRDHLARKRAESTGFRWVSDAVINLRGIDRLQSAAFGYLVDNRP